MLSRVGLTVRKVVVRLVSMLLTNVHSTIGELVCSLRV